MSSAQNLLSLIFGNKEDAYERAVESGHTDGSFSLKPLIEVHHESRRGAVESRIGNSQCYWMVISNIVDTVVQGSTSEELQFQSVGSSAVTLVEQKTPILRLVS